MDKKSIWAFGLIGAGVVVLAVVLFFKQAPSQSDMESLRNQITYYYGLECPHCLRVLQFIEENKIAEKVTFTKKEVSHDVANGQEFLQVAKTCGIASSDAGVPLLYAEGKCFLGETEVMGFFKEKAGMVQ